MKLSKRLQLLADLIEKHSRGSILGDIGSDHGYLPCYVVKNKIIKMAYACDIATGPLKKAIEAINEYELDTKVIPLLGNGIDPLLGKEVDMISISGMGGHLICDIIEANKSYAKQVKVFFLQANSNIDHLREYLFSNKFTIIDEKMVKEGPHIYEVLVVVNKENDNVYCTSDVQFGPILRTNQSPLFKEKWKKQHQLFKKIQDNIGKEHPKYKEIEEQLRRIECVLYEN